MLYHFQEKIQQQCADLVIKVFWIPIIHIFGDTTLEFQFTLKYKEIQKNIEYSFGYYENKEQDF